MIRLMARQLLALASTLFGVMVVAWLLSFRLAPAAAENAPGLWAFLVARLQGDFGLTSSGEPILTALLGVLPASLELLNSAIVYAVVFGILAGVTAARRRGQWLDRLVGGFTLVGYSVPVFWWGLLLVLWFSLTLDWTPVSGLLNFLFDVDRVTGFILVDSWLAREDYAFEAFLDAAHHLILPTLVLALLPTANVARVTRTAMTDTLGSDYIRMAKGQGFPEWRLIWVHALRNAAQPVLAVFALHLSTLIMGLVLVESIFSWPGAGKWLLDALARGDFPSVQGGVLLLALLLVLLNFVLDLLALWLNPQQRQQQS